MNVYDGSTWKTIYGNLASLSVNSAVTVGNLVTSSGLYWANGVSALYGNTQVSSYLPSYNGVLNPSSLTTISGGKVTGYLTGALGANTPNTVVATSVTTSSGGQVRGYITGAIGANTANTGTFTTVTAATVNAGVIGNANAVLYGTTIGATSAFLPTANNTVSLANATNYMSSVYSTNYYVANAIIPIANITVDIGTPQATFDSVYATNFFGTSTTAKYADLAEKYLPDANYEIGTVMMIGGSAEVTQHDGRKVRAIGVISEYPAYKMNDGQVGGVYVALKGRVPVKVVGPVEKGQALIGTAHGLAVAQTDDSQWMFGIALENHTETTIKLIEAVIL
jgi:hypothetical protein